MIPGQRGPKNKSPFQNGKVIVAVNLMVITVMTRHALICDGMDQAQRKNKNKKQEEIKGENVGIDLWLGPMEESDPWSAL